MEMRTDYQDGIGVNSSIPQPAASLPKKGSEVSEARPHDHVHTEEGTRLLDSS